MNKHGATLVELLAAVGALAAMALTIAAMSGMVATSNASMDKNALALSQANVALETVIDGVKNSPVLPGSIPKTVAQIHTCTDGPSPGGGCNAAESGDNCFGYDHAQCPTHNITVTNYTRSLCFKVASGGSAVQYMSPDKKTMQSVFLKDSTVVHAPDMGKYSASNPDTYQVLASNVGKLSFSSGADARLTMRISLASASSSSSSGKSLSGASRKALSGSDGSSSDGSTTAATEQSDLQTSVLPDSANGQTAQNVVN
ncbi:MAG: hypothetical protein WC421_09445 [Elusimicrobiales bacterium]